MMGLKKLFRVKMCYFRPTPHIVILGLSLMSSQTVTFNKQLNLDGYIIYQTLDCVSSICEKIDRGDVLCTYRQKSFCLRRFSIFYNKIYFGENRADAEGRN